MTAKVLPPHVSVAESDSETRRFGVRTFRITVRPPLGDAIDDGTWATAAVDAVNTALRNLDGGIVIVRFPSREMAVPRQLVTRGWTVHPAGALMYWQAPRKVAPTQDDSVIEISPSERAAKSEDIQEVISDAFASYTNHYAANPLIDPGVATVGYLEWALASAADPEHRVFLQYAEGRPIGVAIVSVDDGVWDIELAGIVAGEQRRGHYSRLLSSLLAAADQHAAQRVIISTQSHNVAVQRAWAKLGFLPIDSIDTLHLVRDDEVRAH